jgi:hypothetical protein
LYTFFFPTFPLSSFTPPPPPRTIFYSPPFLFTYILPTSFPPLPVPIFYPPPRSSYLYCIHLLLPFTYILPIYLPFSLHL